MSTLSLRPLWRSAASALIAAVAFFVSAHLLHAQKSAPSLGDKTLEAFGRLKAMQDAHDWDGMLQMLDAIPGVNPGSYDETVILDTKAKIYGAMEQFSKALPPWERALELSDQHGYFSETQTLEIVGYLAQLFAQEAFSAQDPKLRQEYFTKSLRYFQRTLQGARQPTPEAMLTYASLLFQKATANPNQIEPALLQEAREIVNRGLMSAVRPKDGFYQMRLALLQQDSDYVGASDLIELLLQRKSDNKDYWQALVNIYQQLALKAQEKDPTLSREYLVRAIVTYERAQTLGFLNTPKDNLTRATLYLSAKQFSRGTEILHAGLKDGTIESDPSNWSILGRFYQEANQPMQALAVLQEAAGLFPQQGEIEVLMTHLCIQMENTAEALQHAKAAAAKGHFEATKPYFVQYLIAYTAFDLGRLDDAQNAIMAAEKYTDEAAKDAQFPTLKAMIVDAVAEHERKAKDPAKAKQPRS